MSTVQPIWVTPAGSLGTVPEGTFYQVPLQVSEPVGDTVYYTVIAGSLPTGVVCDPITGVLTGIPAATYTPEQDVVVSGADVTSQFAIRAYTTKVVDSIVVRNRFVDRTFTITVAGQNFPQWITPPGQLGQFFNGLLLAPGLQLEYYDNPTPGIPPISLVAGQLPPGLTLSDTGLISGFITPNTANSLPAGFNATVWTGPTATAGSFSIGTTYIIQSTGTTNFTLIGAPNNNPNTEFEATGPGTGNGTAYVAASATPVSVAEFDQYPFDNDVQSTSTNYEFVLKVTDGRTSALRTFSMFVWSTDVFSADTTLISADNSGLTASISPVDIPVILNPQGSIGSVQNDNFFAYQFTGREINNVALGFVGSTLPPGLELDANTGWLYGYIPNLGLTELTFNFSVRVYNVNQPSIISGPYNYSLTTIGPISTNITWLVPNDLGVIVNGAASTFYVRATNTAGLALEYRLKSGSDSKLPQGLTLLPSGNIVGRVSFDNFMLDNGTTTFDLDTTTFDLTYTFTVNAYSANGLISVFNTFTIHVEQLYGEPYNNLYIECMPPVADRELIISLVQNPSIFPPALIYRDDDPNFGIAKNVIYDHAFGLTAATLDDYVTALQLNHYWKNLVLGEIKTAQALDDLGNVLYEVVYSEVIDNMVNNNGMPVGKEVVLAYPVDPNTSAEVDVVFPNALENMRVQVIDTVGQVSKILPRWMQSTQADGRVLGFTPAWVIAYVNPGASGQIAYNIQQQFGTQLNLVDFKADRYEIDRSMTVNWDPATQTWIPDPPTITTFDRNYHYNFNINSAGTVYAVGDTIKILGSQVGGTDVINDVIFVVNTVTNSGSIVSAFCYGTANLFAAGTAYTGLTGTNITGRGLFATWDIDVVPGVQTVFDAGSIQFTDPADVDTNTNEYDRYLLFPKRNVLDNLPQSVSWPNDTGINTAWVNDAGDPQAFWNLGT